MRCERMKRMGCAMVVAAGVLGVIAGCNSAVERVEVPAPSQAPAAGAGGAGPAAGGAAGGQPGGVVGAGTGGVAGGVAGGGLTISPNPSIRNEDVFVAAYAKHNPRMMVMVNRDVPGNTMAAGDLGMIEASIVEYFDNSGKVQVKDADAARAKLTREQVLRVENGDSETGRLLASELQADLLIRVTAVPAAGAGAGPMAQMIAKAVTTTDGRNMGMSSVEMPLPVTKVGINYYTRFLCEELMGQMALKWAQPAEYDPIEVRIYKAATIDDSGKVAAWIKAAPGVKSVDMRAATAGGGTSYAVLAVGFEGAPWMLYEELKEGAGQSRGLKAVDLSNNTISLEVTGEMSLQPTTKKVEGTAVPGTAPAGESGEVKRIEAPGGGG